MNKRINAIVVLAFLLSLPLGPARHSYAGLHSGQSKPGYISEKALSEPAVFAEGVISAGDFDSHPAFTPDGKTLYFVRSTPNFNLWTILVSRFANGHWGPPEVAPFSGQYSDADPF